MKEKIVNYLERLISHFPTTEKEVYEFEKENKELIDNVQIPEHLSAENILKKFKIITKSK
jgi:hypothetical protein